MARTSIAAGERRVASSGSSKRASDRLLALRVGAEGPAAGQPHQLEPPVAGRSGTRRPARPGRLVPASAEGPSVAARAPVKVSTVRGVPEANRRASMSRFEAGIEYRHPRSHPACSLLGRLSGRRAPYDDVSERLLAGRPGSRPRPAGRGGRRGTRPAREVPPLRRCC